MAYTSNQSGRFEVYVRSLEGDARKWQISTDGGQQPRWRADGKELIYAAADGYVMAVAFQSGSSFRPGPPVRLFSMPERPEIQSAVFEDVSPDGQRILLNVPITSRTSIGFHAIIHWTALADLAGG